jgi:4-amino-4-deoxy-L-arabinose transferase-like glycosyltransferase
MLKSSGVNTGSREVQRNFDLAAFAIFALAVVYRLYRIDTPLLDAHSWRQITNADIARHFALGSLNLFSPRVSWGGLNGVVGMEFPLLQWITGLVWRVATEEPITARAVSIVFSVVAVVWTYHLGARLFGRPAGRAAAFLLAVSPGAIYFGHTFLSDTPMLAFLVGAVLAWDRYFDRPTLARASIAAVLTALAPLVKLPAILVLAPIAGLAFVRRGWEFRGDRRFIIANVIAVMSVAAWYWYADWIYLQTGLTQAVFRPSGTYPPELAPGAVFQSVSHWATRERLFAREFWDEMVGRFWSLHLTPFGFVGSIVGMAMSWRNPRALPVALWTLAGVALVIVSAEGQYWHQFHQMPVLPPLALFFGVAAAPIFDGSTYRRLSPAWLGPVLAAAVVTFVSWKSFERSGAIEHLYRPDNLQLRFLDDGNLVQSMIPPDAMVMTVDYDRGGVNSPMLLYHARRQGWSFDISTVSPEIIENLRTHYGLQFFVTSIRPELQANHRVVDYLGQFQTLAVPEEHAWLWVVDLRKKTAGDS